MYPLGMQMLVMKSIELVHVIACIPNFRYLCVCVYKQVYII